MAFLTREMKECWSSLAEFGHMRQKGFAGAAVLLTAFVALCLVEILLHTSFFLENVFWLFRGRDTFMVPYVKWVGDRRVYSLRENSRDAIHSINAMGFRGPLLRGDDRQPLICILGDSVPFGAGVRD